MDAKCFRLLSWLAPNLTQPPMNSNLRADLKAALLGSLVSVTQGFAYGLIIGAALGGSFATVGPLVALYGSVIGGLAAVVFGGNPFSVTGPRAASVLVFSALISYLVHSPELSHLSNPAPVALSLACLSVVGCGLLQMLFAAFRLGRLANYVPLPVVAGFINGSAVLIILSQVWPATGVTPQHSTLALFSHLDEIKPAALVLALGSAAAVKLLPGLTTRLPALLLAALGGTAIFHVLAAFGWGTALGGTLAPPAELNLDFIGTDVAAVLGAPQSLSLVRPMIISGMSMAILATLDTLLASVAIDGLTSRRSNGDRQLMAEGLGNTLAGMFSMSPSSGSLVRSQAAIKAGMVSAMTPIVIAIITLAIVVALRPLISLLSQAVMAGLLIALGIDLFDKWTLARIRLLIAREERSLASLGDLLLVAIVVGITLLADLATAVGAGIAISLLSFVVQMAHSPVRRTYRASTLIPSIYDDIPRRQFIEHHGQHIAILEIEGALFFGTAHELEVRADELISEKIVHIVLDLRRVKHIDATGARSLERINTKLVPLGGVLVVSHVDRERRQSRKKRGDTDNRSFRSHANWIRLSDLGTLQTVGEAHFFSDTDSAVAHCERHLTLTLPPTSLVVESPVAISPLIAMLDRPAVRILRGYYKSVDVARGEALFVQGSPPDGAYFVAAGRVDVLIDIPGTGRKRRVRSLSKGAVFGEMGLLDHKPRSASIVAVEPTRCYWIAAADFERLTMQHADIAFKLMTAVSIAFAERLRAITITLAESDA